MTTLGAFRDDFYNCMAALPQNQYMTFATAGSLTLPAAQMAGAQEVYINASATGGAVAYTTDTAANIIARMQNAVQVLLNVFGQAGASNFGAPSPGVPNLFNASYFLNIINSSAGGTITLTAGAGVTITGLATVLVNANSSFLVTVTGPATVTIQRIGSGTN